MKIKSKRLIIEFIGNSELKKFLNNSKKRLKKLLSYFDTLHLGTEQTLISIKIVTNDEIKSLNKEFRKKNKVTDVLSFPDDHGRARVQRRARR